MSPSHLYIGLLVSALLVRVQQDPDPFSTDPIQALEVWRAIKRSLSATNGQDYWKQDIKGTLIPGGAAGVNCFRGFVISSKPTKLPNVIVLGILDKKIPEVELRFLDRNRSPVHLEDSFPNGTEVQFQGVAVDFVREPFRVIFQVDPSWITISKGWSSESR